MSITYEQAKDELFSTFLTYWNANVLSVLSYSPEVRWRNLEISAPPDTTKHHVRVAQQTKSEEQISLPNSNGVKLYETKGFLTVQMYFSKATIEDGDDEGLPVIAKEAFRSAASAEVWYRNSRIKELPPEEDYYRADVITDYTYSQAI